ncbi:MAG TPA: right-handed parallel beta-helix repeat-containing protein, partial [Candidatus Acidoferrum sp.]|nr:right-handed parallel beta-helix repeat-containing protein [Candidatus Acidoferrum sp.]
MRYTSKVWILSCASLTLLLLISEPAVAQKTIHVPGDAPTIQDAINEAQNGDTVLVAPGTYDENIDFEGKSIAVTSESSSGGGAANTIIMGSSGPTVTFQSNEPPAAVLSGFTIEHQSPGGQTVPGEGIYIAGASPTITGNDVVENDGCGISITGPSSSPAIRGNDISENFSGVLSANPDCGPEGISIGSADSVEISNNTIEGNNTNSPVNGGGGGIVAFNSTKVTIENNAIYNNTGVGQGVNGSAGGGAGEVGGIEAVGIGELAIIQNLIYSNVVVNAGPLPGGILVSEDNLANHLPSGTLTITNNTVVGNQAGLGAGEQFTLGEYPAQSTIENNIFASTDNNAAIYCAVGVDAGFSYNDVVGSTPIQGCGGFNNISADPMFADAAADDFHLTAASPAITAGDTAAPDLPATDF